MDAATPDAGTRLGEGGVSARHVTLAAGAMHACALRTGGVVECWGQSNYGQVGNGMNANAVPIPTRITGIGPAVSVVAAAWSTCALLADATVWCWGEINANSATPQLVAGAQGAISIAAGGGTACALLSSGSVRCWGANEYGQLGNGTSGAQNVSTPVQVSGLDDATDVYVGLWMSCAVRANGTAECWGFNDDGELGNGSMTDSATPVSVSGLSNIIALAPGAMNNGPDYGYGCALLAGGAVQCWGGNTACELGTGAPSSTPSLTPVAVSGLTGAEAIGTGWGQTCAVLPQGSVSCWGKDVEDGVGAISSSNYTYTPAPVVVPGVSGAVAVAGGEGFTCVLLGDDSVACWGINDSGQLGNGTQTDSNAPVKVAFP